MEQLNLIHYEISQEAMLQGESVRGVPLAPEQERDGLLADVDLQYNVGSAWGC